MSVFRSLERKIDEEVRKLFRPAAREGGEIQREQPMQDHRREIIEIQRAILDEVVGQAQLLPRARKVFPFDLVAVTLPASTPEQKTVLGLVFSEGKALQEDVKRSLTQEEIEYPPNLQLTIEILEGEFFDLEKGYHLAFSMLPVASLPLAPQNTQSTSGPVAVPLVQFTLLPEGDEPLSITFQKQRISIGRTGEVFNEHKRLTRRNDIYFDDLPDDVKATVSRAHAHIEYDSASGEYRLFDDGSAFGTSVLHQGKLVNLPKKGGRGFRLQSADEVYFGQARLRFDLI